MGYSSLLQMQMGDDFQYRKYVDEILKSAQRAAQLTSSLLAFSRKQHMILKPVDVNDLIRDIYKLLSRVIGEDIELEIGLADFPLTIMSDNVQIEQAIINLATNARDAMPHGGRLKITTGHVDLDEDFIAGHGFGTLGEYALLSIADTGTGMDDDHKEKIFEPFFTTKEVGKGTGLGLSMVYGTIKQHNGYILVQSRPGTGTTFHIYLPLSLNKEKVDVQTAAVALSVKNATETILLVEDERPVRNIMKEILEQAGYRVIEAQDGEEALKRLQEHIDAIQFIVTDIVMPKMDGMTLHEKAKAMKPGIRYLFVSGYQDRLLKSNGISEKDVHYISKPFTAKQLLNRIREICDHY